MNIENGVINILGKARGSKQGNNLLVQEIQKAGGIDFSLPILLGYTGLTDVLLKNTSKTARLFGKTARKICVTPPLAV